MSYGLNLGSGGFPGEYIGFSRGFFKGYTTSLGQGSYELQSIFVKGGYIGELGLGFIF